MSKPAKAMYTWMWFSAATFAGANRAAVGQTPHVNGALSWIEVVAGSNTPVGVPNGVIEPGESALVAMSLDFTPVGTPVTYQLPGSGGIAPVAGFWNISFQVGAVAALGGSWVLDGSVAGFTASLSAPDPNGSILFAGVNQASPPLGQLPLPTNPINRGWRATWTPSSYSERTVQFLFQVGTNRADLYVVRGLDPNGNPLLGLARATATLGAVFVPVAPAPSAGLCFVAALGGLFHARRRVP